MDQENTQQNEPQEQPSPQPEMPEAAPAKKPRWVLWLIIAAVVVALAALGLRSGDDAAVTPPPAEMGEDLPTLGDDEASGEYVDALVDALADDPGGIAPEEENPSFLEDDGMGDLYQESAL